MCGGWFASVANFKDNVIPPPNLTRLVVMNLLRTSLSRYLSRALSPRSLYFSVFFCLSKQTDASVLMMSCFRPQASMAEAWHSHAIHHCPLYTPQTTKSFSSTCMLQTNSCRLFNMRVCALLFFRWRTLQTFACASLNRRYGTGEKHTQWQPRSRGALSFRATRGVLALSAALRSPGTCKVACWTVGYFASKTRSLGTCKVAYWMVGHFASTPAPGKVFK